MPSTSTLVEFVEVLEVLEDGLHICYRDLDEDDLSLIRIGLENGWSSLKIALSVMDGRKMDDSSL